MSTARAPWPNFTDEEADAVSQVLLSNKVNYWTGTEGRSFEREFAEWTGCEYAIALANGTLALEAALKALDIGPGDEVVVSPRSFMASASSIVTVGATPVFAEVDRDSQAITAATISDVLSERTCAVIVVHLAGWPCDMDPIMGLAEEKNLYIIEDCAQAHGARYKGRSVGSIGDIGCWSFCQDKIMTTGGEGGMVTTNNQEIWSKMWSYKDHGKSWEAVYERDHPPGFRWVHETFGSNWRLTEMQAAIGRIQLRRMPEWTRQRQANAALIDSACQGIKALRVPELPEGLEHACYKHYVFVRPEQLKTGWDRDRVMLEINERGVPCMAGSCSEIYLEKAFDGTGYAPEQRLPVARELGETSLMFQVHPGLSREDMEHTAEALRSVVDTASRD